MIQKYLIMKFLINIEYTYFYEKNEIFYKLATTFKCNPIYVLNITFNIACFAVNTILNLTKKKVRRIKTAVKLSASYRANLIIIIPC